MKETIMRKSLTLLWIAVVFCIFALSGGNVFSQLSEESEEIIQHGQLLRAMLRGGSAPMFFECLDLDEKEIIQGRMDDLRDSIQKSIKPYAEKIDEAIGRGPISKMTREQISNLAESVASHLTKINEATRKTMKEALTAETVEQLDILAFHKFGGTFGGALNADNLTVLNLTGEQREKAAKIAEKVNSELYDVFYSSMQNRNPSGELDDETFLEIVEKMVLLTRRGQREIESLLTPGQKRLAEELMADVPEQYRFLNDFLKNRPWRLDESSWKPGDGAPPNLENYPGEMRLERSNTGGGGRVFPGD